MVDEKPRATAGRKPERRARPPAKVKHRFDYNEPSDAAREVVKRDAMRGRKRRTVDDVDVREPMVDDVDVQPDDDVDVQEASTRKRKPPGDSDPPE